MGIIILEFGQLQVSYPLVLEIYNNVYTKEDSNNSQHSEGQCLGDWNKDQIVRMHQSPVKIRSESFISFITKWIVAS